MRILHLASFTGNVGDNASHIGFHNLLKQLDRPYSTHQLEIRKFYNNYNLSDKNRFDENFVNLVNQFDLLFVGGGGFLDFDLKESDTGTTINITNKNLGKIKVPIFISSIGAHPRNQIPNGNIEKFRGFLDAFLNLKQSFLAVRNDGSKQVIEKYIGKEYADAIPEVLDHGFFYENDGSLYRPTQNKYILINTTSDQLELANPLTGRIDYYDFFNREMTNLLKYILEETEFDIVFAPHIYGDYRAIFKLLELVDDFYLRSRIHIAPYTQGDYGCNQLFSSYKNASLVLGMRFHANVCSISMNVPSIGIAALERVKNMYESFRAENLAMRPDRPFVEELKEGIRKSNRFLLTDRDILDRRREDMIDLYIRKFQNI